MRNVGWRRPRTFGVCDVPKGQVRGMACHGGGVAALMRGSIPICYGTHAARELQFLPSGNLSLRNIADPKRRGSAPARPFDFWTPKFNERTENVDENKGRGQKVQGRRGGPCGRPWPGHARGVPRTKTNERTENVNENKRGGQKVNESVGSSTFRLLDSSTSMEGSGERGKLGNTKMRNSGNEAKKYLKTKEERWKTNPKRT